jgi:hypothetical protein
MVIALFEFPSVLCSQCFTLGIQDHDGRQAELRGVTILRIGLLIVVFIHIDHDDDVVLFQSIGYGRVLFEKAVQLVAPATPIRAELKEKVLIFFFGDGQGIANLL